MFFVEIKGYSPTLLAFFRLKIKKWRVPYFCYSLAVSLIFSSSGYEFSYVCESGVENKNDLEMQDFMFFGV